MKKVLLAFLAFILAIFSIGTIFAYVQYKQYDKEYGISLAQPMTHETYLTPVTRTQLVLNPMLFKGFIQRHLPPTVSIPSAISYVPFLPHSIDEALEMGIPYRVAILGHTDHTKGDIEFLAYVNEKMLGPFLVQQLTEGNFLAQVPEIRWDPAGLQLNQRGSITVSGAFPLMEGFDRYIQDNAMLGAPQLPTVISGEHLWELAIDNGNGELLTLTGLAMDALGVDWKNVFSTKEFTKMAIPLFNKVSVVKMHGDMVTDDEMGIHLRVDALPETEFIFNMVKSMGMPEIKRYLSESFQVELIGEPNWSKEEKAFIGDFQLKGLEKYLAAPFANIKVG